MPPRLALVDAPSPLGVGRPVSIVLPRPSARPASGRLSTLRTAAPCPSLSVMVGRHVRDRLARTHPSESRGEPHGRAPNAWPRLPPPGQQAVERTGAPATDHQRGRDDQRQPVALEALAALAHGPV